MVAPSFKEVPTVHLDTAGLPESRVLIIGTGGTICMQEGPDGLQPSERFLEMAMAPRPTFNDGSSPGE
jgi:lysophospholipase